MEEVVKEVTKVAKVNDKQPSCNLLHLLLGKTISALARKRTLQQCSKAEANEEAKKKPTKKKYTKKQETTAKETRNIGTK